MNINRNITNKKKLAKEVDHLCKKMEEKFKTESNLKVMWTRRNNPTEELLPEACNYAKRYSLTQDIPIDKLDKIHEAHETLSDWFMARNGVIPAQNISTYKPDFKSEDELYVSPAVSPRSSFSVLPAKNKNNNNNGFIAIGGKRSMKQNKNSKKSRKQKRKNTRKTNRKNNRK